MCRVFIRCRVGTWRAGNGLRGRNGRYRPSLTGLKPLGPIGAPFKTPVTPEALRSPLGPLHPLGL